MDARRFDGFSKKLAKRSSRRRVLHAFGGGGIGGTLLALAGLRATSAQDEPATCRFQLDATVAAGPSTGTTFTGELTLTLEPEGAIDAGEFAADDGTVYEVTGQAVGRALYLRIELGGDHVLALTGIAQRDVSLCRGRIDGTFSGPDVGDLGTWQAMRRRKQAAPTPVTGEETGDGGGGAAPCAPQACGGTFIFDTSRCECVCPAPYERCGNVCCPSGSICTDHASGSCSCPGTFELCQDRCVPSCEFSTRLDPDTCQCIAQVQPGCGPGETLCNGMCVFLDFDAHNCGTCGNQCPPGIPCTGGVCQCSPGYAPCPGGCCLA